MEVSNNNPSISGYSSGFDILQAIAYKDLYVNGVCFRVLGIHLMENGCDWNVKTHKHTFFEFHYVTENDVYTSIDGTEHRVAEGHFYLMPPGTYHSHRQEKGTKHSGFALRWEMVRHFDMDRFYNDSALELEKVEDYLLLAHSHPIPDNGGILSQMLEILNAAEQGSRVIELQMEVLKLVIKLSDLYSKEERKAFCQVNSAFLENHIVKSAIQFIEENYSQRIDVNDVSSSVHMSYSHLSRLFKQYTGETINYHINKIRLNMSQKLLRCTDKSIGQIAGEVGFNSEHYFCNIFKKFFDTSPRGYRERKGNLSD